MTSGELLQLQQMIFGLGGENVPKLDMSFVLIGPPGAGTIGAEHIKARRRGQSRFLALLLELPQDTPRDEVWKAYRQARAQKMGLALNISEEELLRAEFLNPEKRLTIKQLLDRHHDLLRLQAINDKK